MDALGVKLCALIVCVGWFIFLWGLSLPAIFAGLALGLMCLLCIRLFSKRTLGKREAAMRRLIGGELALEKLLLRKDAHAQFEAVMWLLPKYPFKLLRIRPQGILSELDGESALVSVINKHPSSRVTLDDIVLAHRGARKERAKRAYICLTAPVDRAAREYIDNCSPEIVIIDREEMIHLAGAASPASNEQLMSLKKRRKKAPRADVWLKQALSPDRARSYFIYGLSMAILYLFTGQPFYPVPAVICLSLCIACLAVKARGSNPKQPL